MSDDRMDERTAKPSATETLDEDHRHEPMPDDQIDERTAEPSVTETLDEGRHRGLMTILAVIALLVIGAFAAVKTARIYGYDLLAWLTPAPASLTLQKMDTATGQPPPASQPAGSLQAGSHQALLDDLQNAEVTTSVRDIPPEVTANKPDFALRNGVTYGYITNLDSETLQRLDAVNGQLNQMVGYTDQMGQSVRQFAGTMVPRMQQVERQQQALTVAITQLVAQLNRIDASVQDIRVNLLQPGRLQSEAKPIPTGPVISGWQVQTIHSGRAWVKSPKGKVVTVVKGDRLKTLGAVAYIDDQRVVMSNGRFIR